MVLFFEVSMTDTDGGSSHPKGLLMLSERQRVTIATALTILAVVVIIGAAGALIWLVAVFFGKFSSVFMPLAVGGVAALVTKPWYDWLRQRLRLPKPLALVAVVLSIVLPVVAFFWFFGALTLCRRRSGRRWCSSSSKTPGVSGSRPLSRASRRPW
jgi:hypothetical protein